MRHRRHNLNTIKFLNETGNYRALAGNCMVLGLSVFSMKMAIYASPLEVPSERSISSGLLCGVGMNVAVACFEEGGERLKDMLKHPSHFVNPRLFFLAYLAPIAMFQGLEKAGYDCPVESQLIIAGAIAYIHCSVSGARR